MVALAELPDVDAVFAANDAHAIGFMSGLRAAGLLRDGPAESYRFRWREEDPGTWLYHCHVEDHMNRGMIGIYRVSRA